MIPECPTEPPKCVLVLLSQSGHFQRQMRDAGASKFNVAAPICPAVYSQLFFQFHNGRRVEPDAVLILCDAPAGHESCGRFYALYGACIAACIAVPTDAPRAVAAHFAGRAVGIVEPHAVIRIALRPCHEHQAVCADRPPPVTQRTSQSGCGAFVKRLRNGVKQDKVVARTVHLGKSHLRPSRCLSVGIICLTRKEVNAKSC